MNSRLLFWLRFNSWSLSEAAMIFTNINPESCSAISTNELNCDFASFDGIHYSRVNERTDPDSTYDYSSDYEDWLVMVSEFSDNYRLLSDGVDKKSPIEWIKRGKLQRVAPDFLCQLEMAYADLQSAQSNQALTRTGANKWTAEVSHWWEEILDKKNPKYANELAIAIEAWKAMELEGKETPKTRIFKWLETQKSTYGKLSNQSKERISMVSNWNKTGGPPKNY